jgi:hypothetical protein
MSSMLKRPLHPDDMFLILGVGCVEFLQNRSFFSTGDIPDDQHDKQ